MAIWLPNITSRQSKTGKHWFVFASGPMRHSARAPKLTNCCMLVPLIIWTIIAGEKMLQWQARKSARGMSSVPATFIVVGEYMSDGHAASGHELHH